MNYRKERESIAKSISSELSEYVYSIVTIEEDPMFDEFKVIIHNKDISYSCLISDKIEKIVRHANPDSAKKFAVQEILIDYKRFILGKYIV